MGLEGIVKNALVVMPSGWFESNATTKMTCTLKIIEMSTFTSDGIIAEA